MAINQFAKISPIVNSQGFLLEKDQEGEYNTVSSIRLKENEIGICTDDNSVLTIINGNIVKLTGGIFGSTASAQEYAANNKNNIYDGQLLTVTDNPGQLYVVAGTKLYNLTESMSKTIMVDLNTDQIVTNVENLIMQDYDENLIMQNYNEYLITNIDIIMNTNNKFYLNGSEASNPALYIFDNSGNKLFIPITEDWYSQQTQQTKCIINEKFKGTLRLKINDGDEDTDNTGCLYEGDTISLIITYIPINN